MPHVYCLFVVNKYEKKKKMFSIRKIWQGKPSSENKVEEKHHLVCRVGIRIEN